MDTDKVKEGIDLMHRALQLLVKVLDAREAEAKAYGSYQVALDNYGASHSQREGMRHTDAMVDASNAEREARVLLLTLAQTSGPVTMDALHGDGSDHQACPACGRCKPCGDCICGPNDRTNRPV